MDTIPQDEKMEARAQELAASFVEALKKSPSNKNNLPTLLYDLKSDTVRQAAIASSTSLPPQELLELADLLPDYDILPFYRSRISFVSLGVAVVLGWLAGGVLSAILGFLTLGGEIIRPLCIFAFIWLMDYFSSNPKARKALLTILGLGGLARFAAAITSGLAKLGSLGSLRSLIFGSMPKPGFFKSAWLWLGAIFVVAFFAKRPAGLDLAAMDESLGRQILQRLNLTCFFLSSLESREQLINDLSREQAPASDKCPKSSCGLAQALIRMLPQMKPEARKYLQERLVEAGFDMPAPETDELVWNEERDRGLYDTLGLVREGDKCKILKLPVANQGNLAKGLVQRMGPA